MTFPQKDGEGRSKPVRLDKELEKSVIEFLESDTGKKLGYKYKTDVINDAVRRFLERHYFEIDSDDKNGSEISEQPDSR